jgi:hypothetical protein
MFTKLKKKPTPIEIEIDELIKQLAHHRNTPVEYAKIMNEVERLHKLKAQDAPKRVSPDTALVTAAHLIGIAVIVRHEQFNIITSKALSFVP